MSEPMIKQHNDIDSALVIIDDDDWKTKGLCRFHPNPELWFPVSRRDSLPAKVICDKCPVEQICLEQALLSREDWGTWGGLSEWDRERLHGRDRHNYERAGRPRLYRSGHLASS